MNYTHDWTREELDILTRNWTDGVALVRIMKLLGAGITRNAMLAKAHDLGLPEHALTKKQRVSKALARQQRGLKRGPTRDELNRLDPSERQKLVKMPRYTFLEHRLTGEPDSGFWL